MKQVDEGVQKLEIEGDDQKLEAYLEVNEQEVNFENRAVPESLQER